MSSIQLRNGQAVILREASKEDAGGLIAYLDKIGGETDFLTFGPGELSISQSKEEALIEETRKAKNKVMILALVGNTIIGCLHFDGGARTRTQHAGELGVSVLKEYWNEGIGTTMIQESIQWAKASNVIRKINLRVRSDNARAVHIYEKLGFIQEGLITREFCISNKFYDFILMGLKLD